MSEEMKRARGAPEPWVFLHSPSYVSACARDAGFRIEAMEEITHELCDGEPLKGLLVVLRA